jgi:hypothetical protein
MTNNRMTVFDLFDPIDWIDKNLFIANDTRFES